jgi:hypothetical protein
MGGSGWGGAAETFIVLCGPRRAIGAPLRWRIDSIVRTALERGGSIIVPATAFAQVVRNPVRQVRLWRMVQHEQTEVVPLDALHAQAVGLLLARSRTSDIADAHVVITSDPFDLKRLDPELRVIAV